jgi:hypothetical protein
MASISGDLLSELMAVPCRDCGYEFEVQLIDVVAQVVRQCPCCRVGIRLVDGDDMSGELRQVDHAFQDLERALRNFG